MPVPLCDAPAEADGTYFVTPSPWPGAADGPECVCSPPHPPAELSESSYMNVSPCSLLWAGSVPMCPPLLSLMAAEAPCQRELFLPCPGLHGQWELHFQLLGCALRSSSSFPQVCQPHPLVADPKTAWCHLLEAPSAQCLCHWGRYLTALPPYRPLRGITCH